VKIRIAITADIPRISEVMRESMAALGARYYDERQTESAVHYIAIVDPQLIDDQTYFVVEDDNEIIACGGWSKRATLFTGTGASDARSLDPDREPARVRAMFVLPADARRGAGRMILDASEDAARDAKFRKVELMATLPGQPLYEACGYAVIERVGITLPDGVRLPCAKMEKSL